MKNNRSCEFKVNLTPIIMTPIITPIIMTPIILIFLGISLWFFIVRNNEPTLSLINSWVFKENRTGPIIGDLGGMTVSIPKPYAHFVEYENDPHFLEPRKGVPPKRTFQSKLRSFGYKVRYPDMAALTGETSKEKRNSTIYNTMWMRVGIDVASYHDKNSMTRLVKGRVKRKWGQGNHEYKKKAKVLYGLVVYEATGYDDANRDGVPHSVGNSNIYYYINNKGKITNYIDCYNVKHDAAPCTHKFMLPGTKAQVSVSYRIGFLSQWQEIQTAVTNLMLSFGVNKPIAQPIN